MRVVSWVVRVGAVLALALVLGAGSAWAQAGTSTIRGTITDPQGAVVPNATVTITNTDTGFTRSQVTSLAGVFSFELITIGHYRVEVTATGFRKKVMSQVEALVGLANLLIKASVNFCPACRGPLAKGQKI